MADQATSPSTGWQNGAWRPLAEVGLAVDDIGCLQGVMVVDRLRTVAGRPLDLELHLERWRSGCRSLGIEVPPHWLDEPTVCELIDRNQTHFPIDMNLVLLATPGKLSNGCGEPTVLAHAAPIPWKTLAHWYRDGQPLRVAEQSNVPSSCWPLQVKNRARIHYFLADREARCEFDDSTACGVLVAHSPLDGVCLTDTSSANLIIVEQAAAGYRLASPPGSQCLTGISLRRTQRLATALGVELVLEPISVERARCAAGLWLTGTTGCLWPAARLDQQQLLPADPVKKLFDEFQDGWRNDIGLDYVQQAYRAATTEKS